MNIRSLNSETEWKNKREYLFILGWTYFLSWYSVVLVGNTKFCFWFSQSLSIGCDFNSISFAILSVDVFLCHFRPRFYDVDEWHDETKTLFQCFSFSWDFILPFLFSIFQNKNFQTALCQIQIISWTNRRRKLHCVAPKTYWRVVENIRTQVKRKGKKYKSPGVVRFFFCCRSFRTLFAWFVNGKPNEREKSTYTHRKDARKWNKGNNRNKQRFSESTLSVIMWAKIRKAYDHLCGRFFDNLTLIHSVCCF